MATKVQNEGNIDSVHDIYLELISDKECTIFSDNIFIWEYKINNDTAKMYYEIINTSQILIRGMNIPGLNIIRKFYYSLKKTIIHNNQITLSKNEYVKYLTYLAETYVDSDYNNKCCICNK